MAEIALRVLPRDYHGEIHPGDVYWADFLKDYMVVLPVPNRPQQPFVEFALNTCASSCTHPERPNRHRCWNVSGDNELEQGDASKLTVSPSILLEYEQGKTIHGFITSGKWRDC